MFLHFVYLRPFNYPLTLAPFAIAIFALKNLHFYEVVNKIIMASLIGFLYPMVNALQIGLDGADFIQYVRTYMLWGMTVVSFAVFFYGKPLDQAKGISQAAVVGLFFITVCVSLQSFFAASGDTSFFNMFGSYQYFGEIDLATLSVDDKLRPPGFYLEPSFCAYVVCSLWGICLMEDKFLFVSTFICAVALLVIQSFTGLIAFFVIALGYVFAGGIFSAASIFASIGLMIFSSVTLAFYGEYISDRVEQVFYIGSSTYYRVVALIPVLGDVLVDHPLGFALGRMKEIVPKYNIPHGVGFGESIDNGLYLLVFYFGWLGLVVSFWFIYVVIRAIFLGQRNLAVASSALLFGFFFNGGIMLPEFCLISGYIIFSYKFATQKI